MTAKLIEIEDFVNESKILVQHDVPFVGTITVRAFPGSTLILYATGNLLLTINQRLDITSIARVCSFSFRLLEIFHCNNPF